MSSWFRFGCLLALEELPFGTPKSIKIVAKFVLDSYFCSKRRFLGNHLKNRKSALLPPKMPPKTSQDRPKSPPSGNFLALKFRLRLGIDFDSVWAPKTSPFGLHFATQDDSKIEPKIDRTSSCRKMPSRITSRCPRTKRSSGASRRPGPSPARPERPQ